MLGKFIMVDNLEYVCLGLFSFFSVANMKCKLKLVEMFRNYLPKFGKDVQGMATGLMITFLPALTEMHEGLVKDTGELI